MQRLEGLVIFAGHEIQRVIVLVFGAIAIMTSACSGAGKDESWQDLLAESDRLAALKQWENATE